MRRGAESTVGRHLADGNNLNAEPDIKEVLGAAAALGRTLLVEKVTGPSDIDTAVATLVQKELRRCSLRQTRTSAFGTTILALAVRHSLPTSFSTGDLVTAGALMSYGPDQLDSYRQAGVLTGRILKGEKPAELPVMQATKFDFVLNLKTAKALGITISPTMLALATAVIE